MGETYPIFFILGRGRSGTTLLREVLNAHPELSVAPESLFIVNTHRKYLQEEEWSESRIKEFVDDIFLDQRILRWGFTRQELVERFLAYDGKKSFQNYCIEVYRLYSLKAGKDGVLFWGDKNPHYSLFGPELISLFPESRFIHLVRDYRDNILSYQQVKFDLNNVAALANRWVQYNQEIQKTARKHPEHFLSLRYEDLVTNPERALTEVCRFLGVEYREELLNFYQNAESSDYEWHKNLATPFNPSRLNQFRRKMPENVQGVVDNICRELGDVYGYEPEVKPKGLLSPLSYYGIFLGRLVTGLEKLLFFLPLSLRSLVISFYRARTGGLLKKQETPS